MKYITKTLSELESLPTLSQGQADDLKIDDGNTRVWLSRMSVEDGMPYNNQVFIEELNHAKGCWEVVKTYQAE